MWNKLISKGQKKMKKSKRIYKIIIIVLVLIIMYPITTTFAKYVSNKTETKEILTGSFYFSSDYLSESGSIYELAPDTSSISFSLMNYEDEYRKSDCDIEYTIKYGNVEKKDLINKAEQSKTIQINDLKSGSYEVVVTSTKPYKKVLKATFDIPTKDYSIFHKVDDSENSPYVLLTIATKDYEGYLSIKIPDGVFLDATQGTCDNGEFKMTIDKYSSNTYRFFKKDQGIKYDDGYFVVNK